MLSTPKSKAQKGGDSIKSLPAARPSRFRPITRRRKAPHIKLEHRRSLLIDLGGNPNALRLKHGLYKARIVTDKQYFCAVVGRTCGGKCLRLAIVKPDEDIAAIVRVT